MLTHDVLTQLVLTQLVLTQLVLTQLVLTQLVLTQLVLTQLVLTQLVLTHDVLSQMGPFPLVAPSVVAGVAVAAARANVCVATGAATAAAASASTKPDPTRCGEAPSIGVAVAVIADFTWSGDQSGWAWRTRATTPAMTAAASDVPLPRNVSSSTKPSGWLRSTSLPGARRLLMWAPGAATSGSRTPSPLLDQSATVMPSSLTSAPATART